MYSQGLGSKARNKVDKIGARARNCSHFDSRVAAWERSNARFTEAGAGPSFGGCVESHLVSCEAHIRRTCDIEGLTRQMPKRVAELKAARGGRLKY